MAWRVIGLDPGHGESAADVLDSGKTEPESLQLARDREKVIPSVLAYREDGTVVIGEQAKNDERVQCYFKTPPGLWDKIKGNRYPARQLMGDYIGQLYRQILLYNPEIQDGKETHLYVGCPSSRTWTGEQEKQAYAQLIHEATGVDLAYIHVVEESTASVFNSFMGPVKNISANDGVLVIDLGSSTADCTYLRTGKVKIVRSWTLGAAEIERAMLNQLLRDQGLRLSDIYAGQLNSLLLSLRGYKERYYSGKMGADQLAVGVDLADQEGKRIPVQSKSGKTFYKQTILFYNGDMDDFMDSVTSEVEFPVTESGQPKGNFTWESGCEAFMREMYNLVVAKNHPCGAVVLTGGASKMPFVEAIARRVFGNLDKTKSIPGAFTVKDKDIHLDSVPSLTVARGLCVIGKTDMQLPELKNSLKGIRNQRKTTFQSDVIEKSANELADQAFREVVYTLEHISGTITVADLDQRISQNICRRLNNDTVTKIVKGYFDQWESGNATVVVQECNKAMQQLYHGLLEPGAITVSVENVQNAIRGINVSGVGGNLTFNFGQILRPILANLVGIVVGTALALVLMWIPVIGPGIAALVGALGYEIVKEWIKNHPDAKLKEKHIQNAIEKFKEEKQENLRKLREEIRPELEKNLDADTFTAGIPDAINEALDIIALRKFEQVDERDNPRQK